MVGLGKVSDAAKGIIKLFIDNSGLLQLPSQTIVPITVELEPKRTLGGHTQITQPEFRIHKVEVIVQTFAFAQLEIRFLLPFVMPGSV